MQDYTPQEGQPSGVSFQHFKLQQRGTLAPQSRPIYPLHLYCLFKYVFLLHGLATHDMK